MCNINSFLSHAFTLPNQGQQANIGPQLAAQTDALNRQTAVVQASADAALAAQKDATTRAVAASTPAIDSESARRAGEDRMRRLLFGSTGVTTGAAFLGAPPLGFRALTGS